jgi:hypothetical protein
MIEQDFCHLLYWYLWQIDQKTQWQSGFQKSEKIGAAGPTDSIIHKYH